MSERITRVEYFYAVVGNKAGQGYRIMNALKEKGVDLIAFTAFPSDRGQAQLDFFVKNPSALQNAAQELKLKLVGPKKAFLLQGDDRPGALSEVHRKLAEAKINVYAANGVSDGEGHFGYIFWVKPKFYDDAAKVLSV